MNVIVKSTRNECGEVRRTCAGEERQPGSVSQSNCKSATTHHLLKQLSHLVCIKLGNLIDGLEESRSSVFAAMEVKIR